MSFNPRDPDEIKGLILAGTLLIFAVEFWYHIFPVLFRVRTSLKKNNELIKLVWLFTLILNWCGADLTC